jgi:hypothetical protein
MSRFAILQCAKRTAKKSELQNKQKEQKEQTKKTKQNKTTKRPKRLIRLEQSELLAALRLRRRHQIALRTFQGLPHHLLIGLAKK